MAPGQLVETTLDENGIGKDERNNGDNVTTPDENGISKDEKMNGEIVIGDMEHDGRVILYIIKGKYEGQF